MFWKLVICVFIWGIFLEFGIGSGLTLDPQIQNAFQYVLLGLISALNYCALGLHMRMLNRNPPPSRVEDPTFLSLYDCEEWTPEL